MSRASRAARLHELLAFDLALAGMDVTIDDEARPADAPLLFPETASASSLSLVGFDEAGRGALVGPVVVGCVAFPLSLLARPAQAELLLGGVDDSKALTPRAREAAYESVVRCARWAVGCASASEIDAVGIVAAAERAARRAYRRLGILCDLAVFDRGLSLGTPIPLDSDAGVRSSRCAVRDPRAPAPRATASQEFSGSATGRSSAIAVQPNSQTAEQRGRAEQPSLAAGQYEPPYAQEFGDSTCRPNSQAAQQRRRAEQPGVAFTRGDMRSLHVAAASLIAKVTRDRLMVALDARFPGYELAQHKGYGTPRHAGAIARLGPSPIHRTTFLRRPEEPKSQSC